MYHNHLIHPSIKNKNAFFCIQSLADQFNVVIVRILRAADHGKGLIDAMSNFGVDSILRRDTIILDKCFSENKYVCQYLTFRGDHPM